MVEGGTAGMIDVRTARPFDAKGFASSLTACVENRDKSKTNDPNLSGMMSNRWKTGYGEIGALAGEDGDTVRLVYHARTCTGIVGDALWNPDRHTFVKPLRWDEQGMPGFGSP